MMRLLVIILVSVGFQGMGQKLHSLKKEFYAMGTAFEVTVVTQDFKTAEAGIDLAISEIDRIEKLISSWDPKSQTSEVNRMAGIRPVVVDQELFDLVRRSLKISKLTKGAFDISYASMDRIWVFDGKEHTAPDSNDIAASVRLIGHDHVILDHDARSIYLDRKGMKIGFGGIGKGYAAMKASRMLADMGILGGIVNAGGDLYAWGESGKMEDWRVAIADPKQKGDMMAYLRLNDQAIVTSGDYERFITIEGRRYAHIIDPRTGWPASGLKSVSVICADAELADALATSIFVMGKENGLHLINQLKGIECLLIDDDDELHTSDNLNLLFQESPGNHETIK